jgi:hypothetical protein
VYGARNVLIVSYVLSDLTTIIYLSIFETESYTYFWILSIQESLALPYTHVDCSFLNALDDKSLISRSVNSYLLKTYDLILDILLSQHKLNLIMMCLT